MVLYLLTSVFFANLLFEKVLFHHQTFQNFDLTGAVFFYISSQCQILTAGQKKTSEERGKINARDIVHVSYQASWPRKMTRI
jgi:hypothetical protein